MEAVKIKGATHVFSAPEGAEETIYDLGVRVNGNVCQSGVETHQGGAIGPQ